MYHLSQEFQEGDKLNVSLHYEMFPLEILKKNYTIKALASFQVKRRKIIVNAYTINLVEDMYHKLMEHKLCYSSAISIW